MKYLFKRQQCGENIVYHFQLDIKAICGIAFTVFILIVITLNMTLGKTRQEIPVRDASSVKTMLFDGYDWMYISNAPLSTRERTELKKNAIRVILESGSLSGRRVVQLDEPVISYVEGVDHFYFTGGNLRLPVFFSIILVDMWLRGASREEIESFLSEFS